MISFFKKMDLQTFLNEWTLLRLEYKFQGLRANITLNDEPLETSNLVKKVVLLLLL